MVLENNFHKKYFKIKIICIVVTIIASIIAFNNNLFKSRHEQDVVILRLAESLTEDNPVTKAMHMFSDLVAKKTGGKVLVKVYSGGQLGEEVETIEQARLGIVDFTRASSIVLANVSPAMGVFTLPYIFRDNTHKYQVLDGDIGTDVKNKLNDIGLIGFAFFESGPRSFYTRAERPIKTIADMKGLKIRVQPAPIMIRMIELLGAVPTPMNYGDVYSAIQTGVVDGAENDYVSYASSAHFEVARNYIEDEHLSPPAVLLMNSSAFFSLPDLFQQAIVEAASEVAILQRKMMSEANDDAKHMLLQKGVSITTIDNAPFRKAMDPIYEEFPQYKDYIERIESLK